MNSELNMKDPNINGVWKKMGSLIYEWSELGDLMVMSFWSVHFVSFFVSESANLPNQIFFSMFFSAMFLWRRDV